MRRWVLLVAVAGLFVVLALLSAPRDDDVIRLGEASNAPKLEDEPPISPNSTAVVVEAPHDANGTASHLVADINPLRTRDVVHAVMNVTCPSYRFRGSKSADGKHTHEAMVKYTRYVKQYCNSTGLLQMHVDLRTYIRFMDTVARIVRLKPGDFIFDWGSGCGTMLNYFSSQFNTTGIGIDVTEAAVQHAQRHGRDNQLFCFMDGSDLRHFPSNSFDAIVSWATLYHVRRTLVQCDIVHHMVRMLKPGAVAYVGHLRTEKTQDYWRKGKCRPPNATIVRHRDSRTFHMPSFRRNNFFSLVITKQMGGPPAEDDGS